MTRRWKPKADKMVAVRMDGETLNQLDALCEKWLCTRGEAVRRLIREENPPTIYRGNTE